MKTKDGDGTGSCVQGEPDSRERVCLLPVEQVFACEMVWNCQSILIAGYTKLCINKGGGDVCLEQVCGCEMVWNSKDPSHCARRFFYYSDMKQEFVRDVDGKCARCVLTYYGKRGAWRRHAL